MTTLRNSEEKAGLTASVERHLAAYFEAHEGVVPAVGLYDLILREVETPLIALALKACDGNQLKTAALLGLNRNTLRKKMNERGIVSPQGKTLKRRGVAS